MITIRPVAKDLMLKDAVQAFPDECCGFLFGEEDDVGICPTFVPKAFAKLIMSNPGSHGRIIVREGRSGSDKYSFAKAVIAELVDNQGLSRQRLRLSFAKSRGSVTRGEYWFVPGRRLR